MTILEDLPKRGHYDRDHEIPCKHCGRTLEEHTLAEQTPDSKERRLRYRHTLSTCKRWGYEPSNKNKWHVSEKRFKEEEDSCFKMACYEKEAQRRAGWGHYAAEMRQQKCDDAIAAGKTPPKQTGLLYIG